MERASISVQAPVGSDATGYAEVYYHPWLPSTTGAEQFRVYLESAYLDFPFGTGRLRAGKGRQISFGMVPSYPNRKTSNYGIVSETFTQDRIAGLQYYYAAQPNWDIAAGLYTSPNISTRATGGLSGVDPSIPARTQHTVFHIADRDIPSESASTDRMTGSFRFGLKQQQKLIAGISAAYGKILPEDLAFVNANTGLSMTGRDHFKWGLDATYKPVEPWVVQGEYYGSSIDDLDYNAWDILIGYEPKDKIRAYVRYSEYNMDTAAIPITSAAPFGDITWDQQQLSLSVVFPIKKSIWLQAEAEFNDEDPPAGIAKVDNNVFFLELFTGW